MSQTCLLTFIIIYVRSAIYTTGIPSLSSEFHMSNVAETVGLTVFVAGYGLGQYTIFFDLLFRLNSTTWTGPMVCASLSEVPQIGRMPIYVLTLAVFVVLQVLTALATNYGILADGLPIPHLIFRLPNPCDGKGDCRRSVRAKEACVRNDTLGCLRRVRTESRTASWKFLRTFRELALDNLGAHVAV